MYQTQLSAAKSPMTICKSQAKWSSELGCLFTDSDWKTIYHGIYSGTLENKQRSFQIKLNLSAIVIKRTLHGFELVNSNKFSSCKEQNESLVHIFLFCSEEVMV